MSGGLSCAEHGRLPLQKRKNKSFKDGVLRLCAKKTVLYDEVSKITPLVNLTGCFSSHPGTLQAHPQISSPSNGLCSKFHLSVFGSRQWSTSGSIWLQEGKILAEGASREVDSLRQDSEVALGKPLKPSFPQTLAPSSTAQYEGCAVQPAHLGRKGK